MKNDFERYLRNAEAFSRQEIEAVHKKSVCIAGCGGLGGHAAMAIARFGAGRLTLADGDVFNVSNLNRQLFCSEDNLGEHKVNEAKKALSVINSGLDIHVYARHLDGDNCASILKGHDLVIDCLDNVPARLMLEACCGALQIPMVHGAVSGFAGQVSCVFPGDFTLKKIYAKGGGMNPGSSTGNPSFGPQLVSAVECCEALKVLAGRGSLLRHKLLQIDMNLYEFNLIEVG